jgi:phage terminase large subunit
VERHIYTGYEPRAAFVPFHNRTQRHAELIIHRRGGKTVASIVDLQEKCLGFELRREHAGNPARFAFMAPTRVRVKEIAWQYLKKYAFTIPGVRHSETELWVEYPNGGRVTLYGADKDRSMGLYLDGIVFDEDDEIPPAVHDVARPALMDRGGWDVHMGVLRGRYNLWRRFEKFRGHPDHFQLMLRASESGILPEHELLAAKAEMGLSAYMMQMECDVTAAAANAVYGLEMETARNEGRVCQLRPDPGLPFYAFWDLGYSDYTTIWLVQFPGKEIWLLDYFCYSGQASAYYAQQIFKWEAFYQNRVAMNFVPHDANQHDKGGGRTYVDHLRDAGIRHVKVVPRTPDEWVGIKALRRLFPRIWIHSDRCMQSWQLGEKTMPSGIDCLDFFSKQEDASSGYITDVTVHDEYSHGADAARTLAEAWDDGMLDSRIIVSPMGSGPGLEGAVPAHVPKVLRGMGAQSYPITSRQARR